MISVVSIAEGKCKDSDWSDSLFLSMVGSLGS